MKQQMEAKCCHSSGQRPTCVKHTHHPCYTQKNYQRLYHPQRGATTNPRVVNISSNSEDSDEVPPTGPQPANFMAGLKKHTPAGDTPITKPKDPPPFLFCNIPGRKKKVNVFCDSGNSHCLFTKGTQRVSRIRHKFVSSCFVALFDVVLVVVIMSKD